MATAFILSFQVCNYSTTTKGNLSIHMQSDKHLNNVQTLQNGGSEAQFNHNHANSVPSASLGGSCGAPSPSKPKQKPTWRCEVTKTERDCSVELAMLQFARLNLHDNEPVISICVIRAAMFFLGQIV